MHFQRKDIKRVIGVLIGATLMAVNLKMFAKVGGIYPGGASGLSMLIQAICETYIGVNVSFALLNICINAIPAYIGFRFVGKKFTLFSILMIIVSGVLVDMIPTMQVTRDPLLVAVFGGLLNAVAISICLSVKRESMDSQWYSLSISGF